MSDSQSERTSEILLRPTEMNNAHDVESGNQSSCEDQKCENRDYRILAFSSIICGLSCIGILSMIYSVKTRATNKGWRNPGTEEDRKKKAEEYSKKALMYGILAIIIWVVILISVPLLVGLGSYLLTLKD